jgi:transposase
MGDLTLAQLATKRGLHKAMISTWRKQAVDGMAQAFSGKAAAGEASQQVDIEKLHAKIGQLVVKRDFLVKVSVG